MNRPRRSSDDREWPSFPLGPILEHYGGEPVQEDHGWYAYRCPFHDEKNKSASVNTTLHVFVCHGCDMKGNAVQLIMKRENKAYGDALKIAERLAGEGDTSVREQYRGGGRLSSRSGNRSGSRAFKRPRRSD